METIQEYLNKIKYLIEEGVGEWGLFVVIFLVGLASFGLGRLSALEDTRPPVSIVRSPVLDKPEGMYRGGEFIGSKTGGVYYYPWCAGADKIPSSKAVWFANEADAKASGYIPAKNCKGL